jgi:hypothetical protein
MRGPFNARCAVLIAQRGGGPPFTFNRPPLIAGGLRRLLIRNLASSPLNFEHPGPFRKWLFFFPNLASGGRTAALPATLITFHTLMFGLSTRAGWKWASTPGSTATCLCTSDRHHDRDNHDRARSFRPLGLEPQPNGEGVALAAAAVLTDWSVIRIRRIG